jgi:hypothetical protein
VRGLAHPPLDRVFATDAAITYINRRCECFLAHDGGLHLVGKGPEIGMSKYRFGTLSNCFLSSSGFVGGRYGHGRTRISRRASRTIAIKPDLREIKQTIRRF